MTGTAPSLPTTSHANSSDLAHSLRDYARPEFGERISLVPFNRFRSDNTLWWICPGSDDPAYHYGKYVAKTAEPCGDFFVGICFEKGIGSTASEFFKATVVGKSWIVRPNWIWNQFFAALKDGSFDSYAAKAQIIAGRPVDVIVSAGTMNPPESGRKEKDEDAIKLLDALPRQKMYFAFDESRLLLVHDHSDSERIVPKAADCRSLAELGAKIQSIKQIDWTWVSIEFGFLLSKNGTSGPKWRSEDVWSNACEPFLKWFK